MRLWVHKTKSRGATGIWALALVVLAAPLAAVPFDSTYFTEGEFSATWSVIIPDRNDTLILAPESGKVSGWNVDELRLAYDAVLDTLYVGLITPTAASSQGKVIFGDADGDGDPSGPKQGVAPSDEPDLGDGEYVGLLLDVTLNGAFDYVLGVPADGSLPGSTEPTLRPFGLYAYAPATPDSWRPELSFNNGGAAVSIEGVSAAYLASPSASLPDFECIIGGFSKLFTSPNGPSQFGIALHAGSDSDGEIGSEFIGYVSVPEPSGLMLVFLGLAPWFCRHRRRGAGGIQFSP